jgi:flagellar biosynthesis protein FlhA
MAAAAGRHRGMLLPVGAAALIFVVLVPVPPGAMDLLLAANIMLSAFVLLTAIYVRTPLEFSVLPSVLLGTTLLRLVLNVASTRLILTAGAGGRSVVEARTAAGQVIWAFSEFVASGSLVVGVVLFAILVVIQFVVVTKGAARISEVAARFVLDAMPGKQLAIDADLAGGLINQAQAQQRRARIASEADLYGAMDGASKFLRGDAVAAAIITFVNILGGLYVGMVQYGWDLSQSANLFTRLTIGDGLVTQIPALLVSVAAALVVTRSTSRTNLGEEVLSQLAARPAVLAITAAFLAALCLTSLPKGPLLTLGAGCAGLAALLSRRRARGGLPSDAPASAGDGGGAGLWGPVPARAESANQDVEQLLTVDPMRIELGYALVRLVDASQGGDLLERIATLRRQMALELGLVVPPIRIRDNLGLDARGYVIKVRGAKVASARLYPNQLLAIAGDQATGKVLGREVEEPAFGTPAAWISPSQREQAERMNYTVIDPAGVVVTHLAEVIRRHAQSLLSRQRVASLLEGLKGAAGDLVAEVTGKFTVGQIQKVLQALLRERVPIRDLETILEALCESADVADDADMMVQCVRQHIARTISQQYCDEDGKLWCVCLDGPLEETLRAYLGVMGRPDPSAVPSEIASRVGRAVAEALGRLRRHGRAAVVLCSPEIRTTIRQLIAPSMPEAAVLGYNEIDSVQVHSMESVGIEP